MTRKRDRHRALDLSARAAEEYAEHQRRALDDRIRQMVRAMNDRRLDRTEARR